MFHLYFGLFDIVLYASGACVAIVLADAICDDRPRASTSTQIKPSSSVMSSSDVVAKAHQPSAVKPVERQSVSTSF